MANLSRLRGLGRPGQVDAEGEAVYVCTLGSNIVDSDLGVGHTTAESALGVRLVLDLTIAPRRTCKDSMGES